MDTQSKDKDAAPRASDEIMIRRADNGFVMFNDTFRSDRIMEPRHVSVAPDATALARLVSGWGEQHFPQPPAPGCAQVARAGGPEGQQAGLAEAFVVSPAARAPTPDPQRFYDFSDALRFVKHGCRMARSGWNGRGMFICIRHGAKPNELGYVEMQTATGTRVPWIASQTDLLNADWYYVNR